MCPCWRFSRLFARAGAQVGARARKTDDNPLFWTETNREISGGFIPPQGMGIFRTETALFWTFPENMRDYTPNGLRVQNTGFFQKIITPGNKTQDFAKYVQILGGVAVQTRDGHGEHLRNGDCSGGLTPCFWPGEPAPPEPLKIYCKNVV